MAPKLNLDRLSVMAEAASQAGRWKARRNGLLDRGAPSNVRNLKDDTEARAQAEASLRRAMKRTAGKR